MTPDSAANIISDAAIQMGLVSEAIADPWASTDDNIIRLCASLNQAGRDLAKDYAWSDLSDEYTFSTVNGTLTTIAAYIDTEVGAIKTKTDQLTFTGSALQSTLVSSGMDAVIVLTSGEAINARQTLAALLCKPGATTGFDRAAGCTVDVEPPTIMTAGTEGWHFVIHTNRNVTTSEYTPAA